MSKCLFTFLFVVFFIAILSLGTVGCDSDSSGTSDNTESADEDTNTGTNTLLINEIVASAEDGGNDWFELYVTQGSVALGDYTVVDDDPDHDAQTLPDLMLSQGEYLIIEAIDSEDECPSRSYCVAFKLGSGDSLTLFQEGDAVDTLDWDTGDAEKGYSYGLLPDGTGSARTLSPTPGSANQAAEDDSSDDGSDVDW